MGAPKSDDLEDVILGLLIGARVGGDDPDSLASAIASVWADALSQFVDQMQVAPGIACSPVATVAPGKLI
ncbi:MAG: hypothetical protein KC431_31455 [Myxococcales bacterium]|nr:hypothetical protein [Myxococcales bacterium]